MKKPIILAVDDDPQVLRAIRQDLRSQYKNDYKILSTDDAQEALDSLIELKNKGEEVALFLSDQRMPIMQGVDFLEQAMLIYPKAKKVLLTAYSDTDAAIKAINKVQLDHYLIKPWDPPTEKLYPTLDDLLEEWQANYQPVFSGLRIIGYQYSAESHALKDYLASNLFPYRWMNIDENEDAQQLLDSNNLQREGLPFVFFENGEILSRPSKEAVAEKLGLNPKASSELYDLVIIGAGPAGLAAAVYGASEGLKTLLIEKHAPGGQAGTSSRIENYLGFPKGLSGSDLARRAVSQASRLGAEILSPAEVTSIETLDYNKKIHLSKGSAILSRSVIVTTGVDYRKLEKPGIATLSGAGIYYGAASTEAGACENKPIFIVGGGNSAGQAAMYLSRFAKTVSILIRKESLASTMSAYLIEQIEQTENITLMPFCEITEAEGEGNLKALKIYNSQTKEEKSHIASALFIFIGARPFTDWVGDLLKRDEKGFIITGSDLSKLKGKDKWQYTRQPFSLESAVPGVFAAGDVRSGAMNRVASAVGEGAMAVSYVHQYLAEV
jgi:thioredoxin reductase (NADPH)